jgi:hypothetical protein
MPAAQNEQRHYVVAAHGRTQRNIFQTRFLLNKFCGVTLLGAASTSPSYLEDGGLKSARQKQPENLITVS